MADKKTFSEMRALLDTQRYWTPAGSLWRHKGGTIYEVLDVELDADDAMPRIVYAARSPSSGNPGLKFSRRAEEWTLDRFAPLI